MKLSKQLERVRSLRRKLTHAFAVTPAAHELSPEDERLLDHLAATVVRRGMARPTILFLESFGPMNFLGSQALHVLTPMLSLACSTRELEQAARLLERRDAIPRLVARIEAKAESDKTSSR